MEKQRGIVLNDVKGEILKQVVVRFNVSSLKTAAHKPMRLNHWSGLALIRVGFKPYLGS